MCAESSPSPPASDAMRLLVRAARGVTLPASVQEAELEAIFDFFMRIMDKPWFEQRDGHWFCRLCNRCATEGHVQSELHTKRAKNPQWYGFPGCPGDAAAGPNAQSSAPKHASQVLTLPGSVQDWFVPRAATGERQALYGPEGEDVFQLNETVATLHRLGIPTFLMERPGDVMRLFLTCQVNLTEEFSNDDEPHYILAAVRARVITFVTQAFAEAVILECFGEGGGRQIAVLDASGLSCGRWAIRFRVVFTDIFVTREMAQDQVRSIIVRRLNDSWAAATQTEPWASAVEVVTDARRPAREAPLWNEAVDRQAYQRSAEHAVVWCDQVVDLLPAGRPLRPYALMLAKAVDRRKELNRVDVTVETQPSSAFSEADWVRLGSVRAGLGCQPTKMECKKEELGSSWFKYVDPWGTPYYHNTQSGETTYNKPSIPQAPVYAPREPTTYAYLRAPSMATQATASLAGTQTFDATSVWSRQSVSSRRDVWLSHTLPDGRVYYYNELSRATSWERPPGIVGTA